MNLKKIISNLLNFKNKKSNINESEKSYQWMWEFSKKVVIAFFLIYIVNYIICWCASFLCGVNDWNIPYIDIFITSTNETTRIVLGGYLIKAMAENVIKAKNSTSQNDSSDNNIEEIEEVNEDDFVFDEIDDNSSF